MRAVITIILLMLGAQVMAQAIPTGPKLPPITGDSVICPGAASILTDAVHGGTWSSSNLAVATVGSSSGILTGISAGTSIITYNISGVITTTAITVNALPNAGVITGTASVCSGATTTLADAVTGGTWSTGLAATASVSATGVVSGISPGTTIISYTVSNSCGNAVASRTVTVNTAPAVNAISGSTTLCIGTTTALTDVAAGGIWHSSNILVATISATGMVTGVATGTVIISYTVTNSCGSATTITTISVGASSAGTITGSSGVNVGSVINLTDLVSGGTWTASNANATVSPGGAVTGIASGTVVISYTVAGSCGPATTTKVIAVTHVAISPISAYFLNMCTGDSLHFWDLTPGGTWSISPVSVATVSPTGMVTAITAGTATLSYTLSSATVTVAITISASPAPISGPDSLCVGSSMLLSDPTPGGVWSSGIPAKASVTPTGLVTCINHSELNVPIYYTMPDGCRAVHIFKTDSIPGSITGPSKVCLGTTIMLSDTTRNGYWSGSTSYATIDGSGDVTGLAVGTVGVTFTSTSTGCRRILTLTINPLPSTINGTLSVCTGSVTFVSDATIPGVSWTSGNPAVATISYSGGVTGIASGTAIITYMAANTCIRTAVVTVNPTPGAVAPILGPSTISHTGGPVTLTDITPGGVWSSSNTAILTVGSATGVTTAVASLGSANINYIVTNSYGCRNFATKVISTSPAPPHPSGSSTTTVGSTVSLTDGVTGGEWVSSDNSVTTLDGDGTVTGIAPGTANITHTFFTSDGDQSATITQIVVNPVALEVTMFPNPNGGSFTVHGTIGSGKDEGITLEITDMLGTRVYSATAIAPAGVINEQINLGTGLENGIYLLTVKSKTASKMLRFVVEGK